MYFIRLIIGQERPLSHWGLWRILLISIKMNCVKSIGNAMIRLVRHSGKPIFDVVHSVPLVVVGRDSPFIGMRSPIHLESKINSCVILLELYYSILYVAILTIWWLGGGLYINAEFTETCSTRVKYVL